MVSKATATRGSAQAIDYMLNDKGQAEEIDRNLIMGRNGDEILSEFREVQSMNSKCINNTYSIVLSPSNERDFANNELRELGREHLKNLGFDLEKTQYIMSVHKSTDQPHVHIIANRIDINGNAHKDNYIGYRAQHSAEKIAKERGLTTAREIQQGKALSFEPNVKMVRRDIKQAFEASKNAKTYSEFKQSMQANGVKVVDVFNKGNQLQGFRYIHERTGINLKASEVGKEFGAKDLAKKGIDFKMPIDINIQKFMVRKVVEIAKDTISRGLSL